MNRTLHRAVLACVLTLALAGCAKSPPGGTTSSISGEQMIVTMQVRGTVDLVNDYYFVCFNFATGSGVGTPWTRNGFTGPVPVVTDFESGGNGFAGGAFTTFVEIHQNQPQGSNFSVYAVSSNLLTPSWYGLPINGTINGNTITFQIPLSYIAACSSETTATTVSTADITALEVNFITTDNVSNNPQNSAAKDFDALGDPLSITSSGGLNGFATIPTGQDTTYSGTDDPDDVGTFSPNSSATNPSETNFDGSITLYPDESAAAASNLDLTNWAIQFTS